MTTEQRITPKDWVTNFENLCFKQPIGIDIGEISINLLQMAQILYPYRKIFQDGNILLGTGTQLIDDGVIQIGINEWCVIRPNGETKNETNYSDFEEFLCQHFIVIDSLI